MRRSRFNILLAGVFIVAGLWSCESYLDQFNMEKLSSEVEFSPSLAAPLAYGSFSIQDILESLNDSAGLISLTEDSLILVSYADTAFSLNAEEVVEIPDHITAETYIQSDINIPAWTLLPEGENYTFTKVERMDFAIEPGDRIDSIRVKAGFLNLEAFSEFRHSGELNITSNNIMDENGDTLDITFEISSTAGDFYNNSDYDLTGYTLTMDEINDSAVVEIYFHLNLVKSPAGIDIDEEAGVTMTFTDLKYHSVFGHIAERSITDLEESIELAFFESLEEFPDIYFADPQFNLAVHNSFGVPMSLDINYFRARSFLDGTFTDLDFKNDTMNPFLIYAPTVEELGQTRTTERYYNVATSNIDELISSVPDMIEFSFAASTGNPPGSTEQNFLLDTSKMVLEAEVLLPMWLSTTGYTLKDTLDIAFDSLMMNLDFIESISFRLTTVNEWPLEIATQVYFVDDTYLPVDSLFDEKIPLLDAAPVNADGEIDRGLLQPNVIDITLTAEEMDGLENASRIMFVATARTTDNGVPTVKFFSHYLLDYQLAVAADFRINPSELNFE